ncbi:MAG: tryptophan--tRNA ligase [Deltaproteobacteria bacterium]|nr:tryptophan--tRNA ligase [Deltaproteobacteria bacterium]
MKRVLSGMRPTGPLHIGHYLGALSNWIDLQNEYECFYFVADWHALSTMYDDPASIEEFTLDIVMDWLSVGLDPERSTLFLQSAILEHAELFVLLSMITPLSWLERVPSYKETRRQLSHKDLSTLGFLGYPLLQTSDIIIYRANFVPVGIDQLPHLELSREIVRRFNNMYAPGGKEIFPEPLHLLTEAPKVPGTDGRKMSKSYGNAIFLKDAAEVVWDKLRPMVTDPARVRRTDPGDPEKCPVFELHTFFTPENLRDEAAEGCRKASIGCIDCKKILYGEMERILGPLREKRRIYEDKPGLVGEILADGSKKARMECGRTMDAVRKAIQLYPLPAGGLKG